MVIYVVAIPWDSVRIDSVTAFKEKSEAEAYAKLVNERGYHGYTSGVYVSEVEVK